MQERLEPLRGDRHTPRGNRKTPRRRLLLPDPGENLGSVLPQRVDHHERSILRAALRFKRVVDDAPYAVVERISLQELNFNRSSSRLIAGGSNARSHVWFRFYNEMPVLVLFAVVFLVVLKPF